MTLKELNKTKVPIVSINPRLEKYTGIVLFQDKLDDANEFLAKVGLPGNEAKKNSLPVKLKKKVAGQSLRKKATRRLVGK